MNALVKKEIRLLLPCWLAVLILEAMQPCFWQDPDTGLMYEVYVFIFGIIILAVNSFGREFSLGTFPLLLSQPIERRQIWRTKIAVLFIAAVLIFAAYFASCDLRLHLTLADTNSVWHFNPTIIQSDFNTAMIVSAGVLLIALTGGLWAALLLRQIAAAFWIALLTPVGLLILIGSSMSQMFRYSSNTVVIAVLSAAAGLYIVSAFWLARRLFFRAQDVGWSGGVISLPDWKLFSAHSDNAVSTRNRKPIVALLKKEFQLQQISLAGAAGLLVLHLGVIVLRKYHGFANSSAGEISTSIFWILWLVMAPIIGSMAVAEERQLGVMEGQLCLPVSRRVQFAIKVVLTLLLGTFLGGVLPVLLENIAIRFGSPNPMFAPGPHGGEFGLFWFQLAIVAFAAGLALISFFASTLAKTFLQAIGLALATVAGYALIGTGIANAKFFFGIASLCPSILPALLAVPTIIVTLLWLGYLNFKNSQSGWPLWRRNLIGMTGAALFITVSSTAIYNRVWEVFEPAEPPHGAAKLSLSSLPMLQGGLGGIYGSLLVRMPDGRVWFDNLGYSFLNEGQPSRWDVLWWMFGRPPPRSAGPQQFIGGSNWVSVTARHISYAGPVGGGSAGRIVGYLDTVGIQPDGTLWISGEAKPILWTGARMIRFGDETDWQQVVRSDPGFLLLKTDGTLWRWGTNLFDWSHLRTNWPSVRASKPQPIGADSDWTEILGDWPGYARKADGRIWAVHMDSKTGKDKLKREADLDQIQPQTFFRAGDGSGSMAYVGKDGTLWVHDLHFDRSRNSWKETAGFVQAGKETNWVAVAVTWNCMVALKADGSLWKWIVHRDPPSEIATIPPTRLGIHKDWVGLTASWGGVVSLAADGSLWFWPTARYWEGLLRAPKQPQLLGNIFSNTH